MSRVDEKKDYDLHYPQLRVPLWKARLVETLLLVLWVSYIVYCLWYPR